MTHIWRIAFVLFSTTIFLIFSCKNKEKTKEYSRLTLIIDSYSGFWLDRPSIAVNYLVRGPIYPDHEPVFGELTYTFDSVENGSVTIMLNSLLDTAITKKIELTKDTIVYFGKNQLPRFRKQDPQLFDLSSLAPDEKICISRQISGCVNAVNQSMEQKLIIQKKAEGYWIDFSSTSNKSNSIPLPFRIQKTVSKSIVDSLLAFQNDVICYLRKKNEMFCLDYESFFVRKGNDVFHFTGCFGGSGYKKILAAIL